MVLPAGIQTTFHMIHIVTFYHDAKDGVSLYKSTSLSVSEWVCLFVCLFPNSSETANPSELKFLRDDSPWDWEGFRLKNIRIRRTVSRKIKKN